MARFKITDAMRTGVLELDRDHQQLVAHLNEIAGLEETADTAAVLDALATFRADLVEHFRVEEGNLEAANYPLLVAHARHHAEIIGALDRLMDDLRRDRPIGGRAADICYHELVAAVLLRDMQFINWMADRKLNGS